MDRLDFKGETPIPVIRGTNYAQEFADRDAIRKRIESAKDEAINMTGPYSVLFDWKKEQEDLKAQKEKAQLIQQKIMRTNALGEAFRLLGEGISAGKGAPVTPRNPNPFILNAVNEYAKSDLDYINRLEGVKAKKLALAQADVQYNLSQNAAALAKAEKQEERSHEESRQAEKELDNYIREMRLQENLYRLRGKEADANEVRGKIKLAEETAAQIELARQKARFDFGMGLNGPGEGGTGIDLFTKPKRQGDAMEFVVPDNNKTIYIPYGWVNNLRTKLQTGKGKYDQSVPQVLRDAMRNEAIKPEALYTVLSENWDYIKNNLLAPDLYYQIYGTEPGQAGPNSGTGGGPAAPPANAAPTQVQLDDGSVDIDDNSKIALLGRIDEALNNTSITPTNKIGVIQNFIYSTYQAAGIPVSKFEAENLAKEYVREWRAEQKAIADSSKVK